MNKRSEMRDFLENHPMIKIAPLDLRDAFFDRTENIVTRYEITDTEKIRYVDVSSLYPYILKTGAFPIVHPNIYVGQDCTEQQQLEQRRIIILARSKDSFAARYSLRAIFFTGFPYREANCCSHCAGLLRNVFADYILDDPADREFEGTWISCELRKAIEKGYLMISVSEIWQYKVVRYDPNTRQCGLFAKYINTFLQLKQKVSGWPSECENDDDTKERYEGIRGNREYRFRHK